MILISEVKFKAAHIYRKPEEPVPGHHEQIDCELRMTFDPNADAKQKKVINGVEYEMEASSIHGLHEIYYSWFSGTVCNALGLDRSRTKGVFKLDFTPRDLRKDHVAMMEAMLEAIKDILDQEQKVLN